MKKSPLVSVLICMLFTGIQSVNAQDYVPNDSNYVEDETLRPSGRTANLYLSQEVDEYLTLMDSVDKASRKPTGYRIQIFSSSGANGHDDALKMESEFLSLYKEATSYTTWNYPNWVVRIGDFRNQLEALEFHTELREQYPASFIVRDEIKTPYSE